MGEGWADGEEEKDKYMMMSGSSRKRWMSRMSRMDE